MPLARPVRVIHFGGSLIQSEADLPVAVQEIYRAVRLGSRVVAAVSAFGAAGDDLLKRAQQLGLPPRPDALAALLATGAHTAAALLTLALDRSGVPATFLDSHQIGLETAGDFLSAEPVALDARRLLRALDRGVVVIPDSIGHDGLGRATRIGRGGAEAAVRFLGKALGGSVKLIKDLRDVKDSRDDNGDCELDRPLRVVLLGAGTVGGGVLERLASYPDFFEVVGVGVRSSDLDALVEREADVVIELLGGVEPATRLIARALERGRHVVTANKAVLAQSLPGLAALARKRGVLLRYSAAVGGSMPALETLSGLVAAGREIRSFSGVLNGTSNFVLDRWCEGQGIADAVGEAQRLGFAEADPTLDLDGSDAAQKLALLAHAAFGVQIAWQEIPRLGLDQLAALAIDAGSRRRRRVRLVARCERAAGRAAGIVAWVRLTEVPANHLFAGVHGADNALSVELARGETVVVTGRGAGRWPTGEAVLADLFDLVAARQASLADQTLALEVA